MRLSTWLNDGTPSPEEGRSTPTECRSIGLDSPRSPRPRTPSSRLHELSREADGEAEYAVVIPTAHELVSSGETANEGGLPSVTQVARKRGGLLRRRHGGTIEVELETAQGRIKSTRRHRQVALKALSNSERAARGVTPGCDAVDRT